MVQEWPRDAAPRHLSFHGSRYHPDIVDHRRYYESPEIIRHQPPMAIDTALRSHCGIWAKQYFVAVIMDDGTPTTFFSPGQKLHDSVVRQFFDAKKFQQVTSQLDSDQMPTEPSGPDGSMYFRPGFSRYHHAFDRFRLPSDDDADDTGGFLPRSARKRPRPRQTVEEEEVPVPILSRRGIRVSDSRALWSFYDQRFKSCQQSACKLIAKAWVKAVEPKKQSTHPYTGSDAKAPEWWPKPWGPTKEDRVRHKEPDHLYKRERVHLLNHILSLIVQPMPEHEFDIRKLHLTVKKLEECTNEALSGFFSESPQNASKKRFLNEIFKVARQQERYRNGEIDGATEVYVLNDERNMDHLTPENEEAPYTNRHPEDQNVSPTTRSGNAHSFHHTPPSGQSPPATSQAGSFMNDLPMRNSQQQPPPSSMVNELGSSQPPGFNDDALPVNNSSTVQTPTTNIGVDMIPSANESSRRSSAFPEYNQVVGNGMYQQQWPPGSGPPTTQVNYSNKQNGPAQSFVTAVPATPPPSYMGNSFETMSRPGYDPGHGQVYRSGEVPPGQVGPPPNYSYISGDGRGLQPLPGVSEVIDSVPRGHLE